MDGGYNSWLLVPAALKVVTHGNGSAPQTTSWAGSSCLHPPSPLRSNPPLSRSGLPLTSGWLPWPCQTQQPRPSRGEEEGGVIKIRRPHQDVFKTKCGLSK